MMIALSFVDVSIVLFAAYLLWQALNRNHNLPLPPGPKGYPVIGNLLGFPSTQPWRVFAEWSQKWGGILSVNIIGQTMIIINDPQIAVDVLGKTGSTFADRPPLPMATLCGYDRVLSSARYGPRFLRYRKLIGRVIGTRGSMVKFQPTEDYEATMFLKRVLDSPRQLDQATRKTAGALILDLTYGYNIREEGSDPLVDLADKVLIEFSIITNPGAFLVDLLPWLKYVPSWMPGAGFKRLAREYTKTCDDLATVPLAWVQDQMTKGQAKPSYAHDLLREENLSDEAMYDIKWSAASFYGAGADTTVSVMYAYFLTVALHPKVEADAHAEMDRVVGRDRLPTFEDRDQLPYVDAICKELLRWLPIAPLAVPHRATRDATYKGYSIPEGSWVIANIWKFLHNPNIYKEPMEFNPDRFMGLNPEQDPKDYCFGFGRRVCPGIHLADSSIWINIAKSVAAFNVTKTVGPDGQVIVPVVETTDGVLVRPKPFVCDVKPRFPSIPDLVHKALAD